MLLSSPSRTRHRALRACAAAAGVLHFWPERVPSESLNGRNMKNRTSAFRVIGFSALIGFVGCGGSTPPSEGAVEQKKEGAEADKMSTSQPAPATSQPAPATSQPAPA